MRGLAYYTGLVFEMFDRRGRFRAIAGGGRYDRLLSVLSDGAVDLPAVGFGLGDVVLGEMITGCEPARAAREMSVARALAIDLYAVVAAEEMRPHALAMVQELRNAGYRVDLPLAPAKVGRQFQNAEQLGATAALLFGTEWPMVRLKVLATRQEETIDAGQVGERLRELFAASIGPIPPKPDTGHPRQSER